MVAGFEPIFRVADVPQATDHYAKMGFEISHHDETYAFVHRDRDLTVHLTVADGDERPGGGALYIHCDDADQLASEWRKAGLEIVGPEDQDYGKRRVRLWTRMGTSFASVRPCERSPMTHSPFRAWISGG